MGFFQLNSDIVSMYVKIVRSVSFQNLPECLKHAGKKSKVEAVVHFYEVHKNNILDLNARLELLDKVLEDLLTARTWSAKLLPRLDGYKDDLYSDYQVKKILII